MRGTIVLEIDQPISDFHLTVERLTLDLTIGQRLTIGEMHMSDGKAVWPYVIGVPGENKRPGSGPPLIRADQPVRNRRPKFGPFRPVDADEVMWAMNVLGRRRVGGLMLEQQFQPKEFAFFIAAIMLIAKRGIVGENEAKRNHYFQTVAEWIDSFNIQMKHEDGDHG